MVKPSEVRFMSFFSYVSAWFNTGLNGNRATRRNIRRACRASDTRRSLRLAVEQLERRELLSASLSLPSAPISINDDFTYAVANLSVTDPGAAGNDTVYLQVSAGNLSVNAQGHTSVWQNGGSLVGVTGTVANLNAALASVEYTPPSLFSGTVQLSGSVKTFSASVTMTITPGNSAPTINGLPIQQASTAGTTFSVRNGNAITVADTDGGTGIETVYAQVSHGTLTLDNAPAAPFTLAGSGSSLLTLTGTLTSLNAALDGLHYHSPARKSADLLNVLISDAGNAAGKPKIASLATKIPVSGADVNPTATGPLVGTFNIAGVSFSTANGNPIRVSDGDANGAAETVWVQVSSGTLAATATTGVTIVSQLSNRLLTLTGQITGLNAALNDLHYTPASTYVADYMSLMNSDGTLIGGLGMYLKWGPSNSKPPVPTVAITGAPANGHTPEGAAVALGSTVTGTTPAVAYTYTWQVLKNGSPFTSASGTTFTFNTNDNGAYTANFTVTDSFGQSATATQSFIADNVAPTAAFANTSGTINEGSAALLKFTSPTDPSTVDTQAGLHYTYSLTTAGLAATYAAATDGASKSFSFADNGAFTVYGRVYDKDGGFTQYSAAVNVNNVAPTVTAPTSNPSFAPGVSATVNLGSFTDPGVNDGPWAVAVTWGDGTSSNFTATAPGALSYAHTFTVGGNDVVKVTVTDKDGGANSASSTVVVGDFIVTPFDTIPNFGAHPTVVSAQSGAWSNPATWSIGVVPTTGDIVSIVAGTTVTYDVVSTAAVKTVAIQAGGHLVFRTDISTTLTVVNLLVMEGGELQVGTSANPVAANVSAQIIFPDLPIDTTADPSQYGDGLIGLGTVTMHGAVRSESFVGLATEPKVGDTTLTLATAVSGWQPGDRLELPDSKQWAIETTPYVDESEDATIASISSDGLTLTLTAPLLYNHPGGRDGDGVLTYLPDVGNRTRNVVVRSANAAGTRGHALFTYRATVDIEYVAFAGLGRTTIDAVDNTTFDSTGAVTHIGTNQNDRNPVTFLHLFGPSTAPADGYQYTFSGNSVFCPMPGIRFKWGITINDSHYGLIQDNFIYNWAGAGLVTETGNESFNVIASNFVLKGRGEGDRAGSGKPGDEGAAFWFRGPNNYVRDNVAANYRNPSAEAAYGFKFYFVYLGNIRVPNFQGADTSVAGEYTVRSGNAMPLVEFARNETYGMENGLTIWWLNAFDYNPQTGGNTVIKDFVGWNVSRYGFYGYPMSDVTFEGFTILGDKRILSNPNEFNMGMYFSDYMTNKLIIQNANIQGMRTGILAPYFGGSTTVIQDSYLRNSTDIEVDTPAAPGSDIDGSHRKPTSMVIRDVVFASTAGWALGNGKVAYYIYLSYNTRQGSANVVVSDTVFVYNYNRLTGDNFEVYYNEQIPGFVVPQTSGNLVGSPAAGLTNQQNWDTYGIAIAGQVAPPTATAQQGIHGLVNLI
jgi:hypothetical protein